MPVVGIVAIIVGLAVATLVFSALTYSLRLLNRIRISLQESDAFILKRRRMNIHRDYARGQVMEALEICIPYCRRPRGGTEFDDSLRLDLLHHDRG